MKNTLRLSLLFGLLLSFGCRNLTPGHSGSAAETLAHWMTGSFSSEAQALESPDDFFDIRLFMVPVWTEAKDGHWLYVEQAAALSLARPYRQRLYHIVDTPKGPRSDVYELPGDPLAYAGAWRTPEVFNALDPDDLIEREGCSIYLRGSRGVFEGETRGPGCSSTLGGATFATSEVTITQMIVKSWDRGFDDEGVQRWGAVRGPYVFIKQPPR